MSRVKKTKKTFAQRAYTLTKVDSGYSQAKIIDMLEELGITDIQVTQTGDDFFFDFLAKLRTGETPRRVRIKIPLGEPKISKGKEVNKDILFRVAYYHLKNRFVAVSRGLREFEEEFLADLVIVYNGKTQRLGDVLVPEYKRQLIGSKIAVLSLSSGDNQL